jgi:hypothetical protein
VSIDRKRVNIIPGKSYLLKADLLSAYDVDFEKMDTNLDNKPRLALCLDVFDRRYTKMVRWLTADGIRYNRYTTAIFNVIEYDPENPEGQTEESPNVVANI